MSGAGQGIRLPAQSFFQPVRIACPLTVDLRGLSPVITCGFSRMRTGKCVHTRNAIHLN